MCPWTRSNRPIHQVAKPDYAKITQPIFRPISEAPPMHAPFSVSVESGVRVPMRDGVNLIADLYHPATPGKYPVILQRTAYGRITNAGFAIRAAGEGYAVLLLDIRGRFDSEGEFHTFINEQRDGFDTCEWICAQPWSNGRIGMFGSSYLGLTQWQAALAGAPRLQAIVPHGPPAHYHDGLG